MRIKSLQDKAPPPSVTRPGGMGTGGGGGDIESHPPYAHIMGGDRHGWESVQPCQRIQHLKVLLRCPAEYASNEALEIKLHLP